MRTHFFSAAQHLLGYLGSICLDAGHALNRASWTIRRAQDRQPLAHIYIDAMKRRIGAMRGPGLTPGEPFSDGR